MTATLTSKQEEEKIIIKYFQEKYDAFPSGKLSKSESPDFILRTSKTRSIGIEITKLFNSDSRDSFRNYRIASAIHTLNKESILNAIQKKEEKLSLYQEKRLDYYWLIIVIESLDPAPSKRIQNMIESWEISSSYHKIFIFDLYEGRVWLLK